MALAIATSWRSVELLEVEGASETVLRSLPQGSDALPVPGYLLASCGPGVAERLARHPMVRRVLPGRVSCAEVEAIRRALEPPRLPPLEAGAEVAIVGGPAAGLQGVVQSQDGDEVMVVVELRSGAAEVTCRRSEVQS